MDAMGQGKNTAKYRTRLRPSEARRGIAHNFMFGLGDLLVLAQPSRTSFITMAAQKYALQSDMVRVGADGRRVIDRERRREKASG